MKKILFVAAATMLGLSSCSDNEIFNSVEKSKTPITVNVYNQSQTRAVTETTLTSLQSGFKFVALNGSTEVINSTVTFADSKWSYGEAAYWPTNESTAVTFFGLYPTTNTLDAANDKATITVNGSSDAVVAYSSKSLSQAANGNVNLSFSHILGQVLVSAMGDDGAFTYTVTSVTLNTDNVIDYKYSNKSTTAASTSAKTNFTYLAAGSSVAAPYSSDGIFTAMGDANVMALPALPVTLTITYTVSSTTAGSQTLTKSATFTPQAGKKNRVNLTLPNSRTAMSFTVDSVDAWGAETNATSAWN